MPETARITMTVTMDVLPSASQSLDEATEHFRKVFEEYLTLKDFPFWEDYGATIEDVEAFRADGEEPCWGGYEGPFVTHIEVRDDDAVQARADDLTKETGTDSAEALTQARHEWATDRERIYPATLTARPF